MGAPPTDGQEDDAKPARRARRVAVPVAVLVLILLGALGWWVRAASRNEHRGTLTSGYGCGFQAKFDPEARDGSAAELYPWFTESQSRVLDARRLPGSLTVRVASGPGEATFRADSGAEYPMTHMVGDPCP